MQLLLIVVGLALIVVGLGFSFAETAREAAKGAGGKFSLEGPAWLLLVGIGVAVVIFGAVFEFEDDDGASAGSTASTVAPTEDSQTTTESTTATAETAPPTPAPSTGINDPEGCQVTIGSRLASLHEDPDVFSIEITRIPAGTYPVIETQEVEFVSTQRWFLIEVADQMGWVRDSTFDIASKTGNCT